MIITVRNRDERDLATTEPHQSLSPSEDLVVELIRSGRAAYDLLWHGPADDESPTIDLLVGIPGAGFVAVEVVDGPVSAAEMAVASTQAEAAATRLRARLSQQERSQQCGEVRWAHAVIAPGSEADHDVCPGRLGRGELDFLVERLAELPFQPEVTGRSATDADIVAAAAALQCEPVPA